MRSNSCANRFLQLNRLSEKVASYKIFRCRERSIIRFPYQPIHASSVNDRRVVSLPMAGRIFFKWIKQHLRVKKFYGTSENAVKTQIWIAISAYILFAIMKKRLKIDLTLYTILQILSISLFEKKPIYQMLTESDYKDKITISHIQLNLYES